MNSVAGRNDADTREVHIRICARCGSRYDWRRSPSSSLKMTYCGSLCETADLGFTIEAALLADQPDKQAAPPAILEEAEAAAEAANTWDDARG